MSPENTGPAAVIVLAAGAGTRMKSRTPKILHEIGGRSLVGHALNAARAIRPRELALVVRHERDQVAAHIAEIDPHALIVDQDDVPGTGRAVESTQMPGGHVMSGMVSDDGIRQLDAATGPEAAKLFLTQMIAHHEGAVEMANAEVRSGKNPDAIKLAKDVAASQTDEIKEMKGLLAGL